MGPNEIEIRVTSEDHTQAGFASADRSADQYKARTETKLGQLSKKYKDAGEKSGKDFGDGATKELEKGLAKAESSLTAAKARMAKALALGAGDKQKASIEYDIKIHEASIAKVKEDIRRVGEESGKRLGDGVDSGSRNRFGKIIDGFASLGIKAGMKMSEKVTEGLATIGKSISSHPVIATGIISAIAAIGLFAAPFLGGVIAGAIATGVGAGVIAAGIKAASDNNGVQRAAKALSDKWQAAFKDFGAPFVAPVLRGIDSISRTLDRVKPQLDAIGNAGAGLLDKLIPGLSGLIENVMPAIKSLTQSLSPMFEKIGEHLPRIGNALASFLGSIEEGMPGATKAMDHFLTAIEHVIGGIGKATGFLAKMYDAVTPGTVKVEKNTEAISGLARGMISAEESANRAAIAITELTNALVSSGLITLDTRSAMRQLENSIDAVTKSAKTNGKTLDIGTEKGRANQAALDDVARATFSVVKAQQNQRVSQTQINNTLQRGANDSFNAARAMGMSARAAIDYTTKLYGIPPSRKTLIEALGAARSAADVRALRAEIERLRNRTVTVTTVVRGDGTIQGRRGGVTAFAHGGIKGAASGGNRSGLTWTGEDGPELLDLPAGTKVHTAGDSKRLAAQHAGGAGGGRVVLEVRSGGSRLDDLLVELLRKAIRIQGGDVQAVLGVAGAA